MQYLFRLREEEEKKNKLAALVAVRTAKSSLTATVITPEEIKHKKVPNVTPKPLISPSNDIIAQTSKEK